MNAKAAVVLLSGMLFACAPVPPPSPPPPPAAPVAAEPEKASHVVAIRNVTCGGLLSASDEDRATASTFFIGYTAQRRGLAKIDVAEIGGLEAAALGYCEAYPDRPAATAFMKAFADNGR
jgi:hypothetical protein